MHTIPKPHLLDPDRVTSDDRADMTLMEHRSRAQQLDAALHASCEYATQLWQHLAAARGYLWDSLPSDPRAPGTDPHLGASPTGPDDEEGWQRWIDAFSAVTSILAGPHGDSGFGLDEARHAARARRDAPNLRVLQRFRRGQSEGPVPTAESRGSAAPAPSAQPVPARPGSAADGRPDALRLGGLALLVLLALRGMRRRSPAG